MAAKKDAWVRAPPSFVEREVGRMLHKMRVPFAHHQFVKGCEVDFLIPRPGRRGLVVEVDGGLFHRDEWRREDKDWRLTEAGWDVIHFWGSEVQHTPDAVRERLRRELEGVPRFLRVDGKIVGVAVEPRSLRDRGHGDGRRLPAGSLPGAQP